MMDVMRRSSDPVAKPEFAHAHGRVTQEVDAQRARASAELPGWACHIVEHFAGTLMSQLGYEVGPVRPGIFQKLVVDVGLRLKTEALRQAVERELKRRVIDFQSN